MLRINRVFTILLLVALIISACQPITRPAAPEPQPPQGLRPDAPPYAVHGSYAVGTREFVIETPERSIPVTVWYPALNPTGALEEVTYSMDVGDAGMPTYPVLGHAIRSAEPDAGGAPYPLVLYSHGLNLHRQGSVYLLEHWASQGFVVLAGNHEDNWGNLGTPFNTSLISRPADITRWIDFAEKLTAEGGDLAKLIDIERVGVAGSSRGGYTALSSAGARMDIGWYLGVWCAAHPGDPKDPLNDCYSLADDLEELAALAGLTTVPEGLWPNLRDSRVDVVVALSPASYWGPAGSASVEMPVLMLFGSHDTWLDVDLDFNTTYEHLSSPNKTMVVLENADHIFSLNDCNSATGMADIAFAYCSDPMWDMDRAHDLVNHFTTAFLKAELYGDAEAAKALAPENVAFPGIQFETTEFGK